MAVLGLATLTFVVGLSYRGLQDALEAAVALTVSAPEGLPAVVTVTLAMVSPHGSSSCHYS